MKEVSLLYDVSTFTMEKWNDLIGLNDLAKDICSLSGILIYNVQLDAAHSASLVRASGSLGDSYDNMNKALSDLKYLFNLEKSTKIIAYQKMKEITNDETTKPGQQHLLF